MIITSYAIHIKTYTYPNAYKRHSTFKDVRQKPKCKFLPRHVAKVVFQGTWRLGPRIEIIE